jgi:hypothetical protein
MTMFKTMLLSAVVALAWTLSTATEVNAYGARHVGYTHVGPSGVYHTGRTVGYGPGGVSTFGHTGAYGYGGASYHAGYDAHVGYGGAAAGGYRYGSVGGYSAGHAAYGYRGW